METFICALVILWGLFRVDAHHRSPTFVVEPEDVVQFSNSSGAVVTCSSEGSPQPNVVWLNQDGTVVRDIPDLRRMGADGSLTFLPFPGERYRPEVHSNIYRCVATNSIGSISSRDVHVRAVVPQPYEIRLSDVSVMRDNMAILRCLIPSHVVDHVRVIAWERSDGLLITPDSTSGRYGFLEKGDLYLSYSTERDSTNYYWCHTEDIITKNKKISVNRARILVTEPTRKQIPRILEHSRRVVVSSGHRVAVFCLAQGNPAPVYRWFKKKDESLSIPSSLGHWAQQEAGVLVFPKAVPSDTGVYVCLATNSLGEDKIEIEIRIEERLQISMWPKEVRAHLGQAVNFNCSVSGNFGVKIQWMKDAKLLSPMAQKVAHFPTYSVLRLTSVRKIDEGVYQCFAKYNLNSVQTSATLVLGGMSPSLISTFADMTVRPGTDVSLTCSASGNPSPDVSWTLDGLWTLIGNRHLHVNNFLNDDGTVSSHLNVSSVNVSDGGFYSCEARNEVGTASHTARINVIGPLIVRHFNGPVTTLSGATVLIQCPFGGYPYDNIRWRKDNLVLPTNHRQKVYPNGTLSITRAHRNSDNGLYTCEVTSRVAPSASGTVQVDVRTGPRISPFRFEDGLHEGMRTAVACVVSAGDKPFVIQWLKDKMALRDGYMDATIMYQEGGFVSTLTIDNLSEEHNGNYSCTATNDVAVGSYNTELIVKIPPRWVLKPQDTSAIAGGTARIDCRVHGVPEPHVRWKLNSGHSNDDFKTIVSSSRMHILVNGSLNFVGIESSDAGSYLCEADNSVGPGPISALINLTVHTAPRFEKNFVSMTTRRGQRIVIDCHPSGERPILFYWRKNGVLIGQEQEAKYTQVTESGDDSTSRLIIIKAERKDNALFACTATNDYGYDTHSVQVSVEDIPDAPQNLEIHDTTSQGVRLTWDQPFDGNTPIVNYTVAWRRLDGLSEDAPVTIVGSETSITVRNLQPITRYFFRVKCSNMLGESQYSAEVAVTTLQEPPKLSPTKVRAIALSTKTVNVTWQFISPSGVSSDIEGFYVGYKFRGSTDPYTFAPTEVSGQQESMYALLTGLTRSTPYAIVVQAYNSRGAGPPSLEAIVKTLEYDPPEVPLIKMHYATSSSIKISWEPQNPSQSPIQGYVLHHRLDGNVWKETRLQSELREFTLHGLRCGNTYQYYLAAYNSAGRSRETDIAALKTTGNAPTAPDKRFLLDINSTFVLIHLRSWKDGGCPIMSFAIQYKTSSGADDWTMVTDRVQPGQNDVILSGLTPGTWYTLYISATNDAGATDAEYTFGTLTVAGEYPPNPFQVKDVSNDTVFRHLTITVPLVSFAFVFVLIFCTVCFVMRSKRSSDRHQPATNASVATGISKPEQYPLAVAFEAGQEPLYFPSPYSRTRQQERPSTDPRILQFENKGAFDCNATSCRTYDVPYPIESTTKFQTAYEPQVIYISHNSDYKKHEEPVYAIPDRDRCKRKPVPWFAENTGNSSTESDNEEQLRSSNRQLREEARESETECDRLWKAYHESKYEERKCLANTQIILT